MVGAFPPTVLAPGGLYFLTPGFGYDDPSFPTEQPLSAYMQGPWFRLSEFGMAPPIFRAITSSDMRAVPAPEPSAFLLLGLGFAVIAMRRIKAIRSGLRSGVGQAVPRGR